MKEDETAMSASAPFTVVHFDADPEEAASLEALSPLEWETRFVAEPLTPANAELAREADAVTVFVHSRIIGEILERLPRLRLACARSTGYDHIDLAACRERGVAACNVPTYGENTVAEHTFGLILSLSRNIHRAWERTRQGNFSLEGLRGFDLQGRTLGIVGAGHIGLHVARIARGFGMRVLVADPREDPFLADLVGFAYAPLGRLLAEADIVSLHAPLLSSTHHLIDRDRLGRMKPGALLINTARGGLIDTAALLEVLEAGRIAGAALDVFEGEELKEEDAAFSAGELTAAERETLRRRHEMLRRENVVLTPHMAFYSQGAEERIRRRRTTLANLRAFFNGSPQNLAMGT
jgi:D-lactate dehydrogenase